ncbi:MAG: serine hydrolase domain-containing protein, partial [Wenzhouxiangella sp.]|nr:serine hydrolase domain-containing protein [Wenzhouxiangella sp.]
ETLGDGGLYSCLSDLLRWQSLFRAGEVLSRSTLERMKRPGRLDSGEEFEYGLGLQIERRAGGRSWWGHSGSWTQSAVMIGRYPEQQLSVIVLSNEFMAPVERISQRAAAMASINGLQIGCR